MITSIPRNLAVVYDAATDALQVMVPAEVPALSPQMLQILCKRVYDIDLVRYRQTPPGDRSEIFKKKLKAAAAGRIQQILGGRREINLFKSTQATDLKRYYHG